jgi:hypothetical protein
MLSCRAAVLFVLAFTLPLASTALYAQHHDSALSEAEVEKLRDAAYVPSDRVSVFINFLDTRTKSIQDLFAHPRRPGREEDAHDLFEQITEIADELDDNLDDYAHRHQDIRKALPKLLQASERWSTELKTPPDNEAYSVSRKLALESINDIRETVTKLIEDQKAWFAAHPHAKENKDATLPDR